MCPCEHVFLHQFKYIWLIFLRNYYKRKPHRQQFNICKTSLSKITLWGAFLKHVFKSSVFSFEFFFFQIKELKKVDCHHHYSIIYSFFWLFNPPAFVIVVVYYIQSFQAFVVRMYGTIQSMYYDWKIISK